MVISMAEYIDVFINKEPQSYRGYFSKGLLGLDEYILNSIQGKANIGTAVKALEKAAELSQNDEIIKYYFISLLIEGNVKKIIRFKSYIPITLNEYKFNLINKVLLRFSKGDKGLSELSNYKYFDSLDYLILYVLNREYSTRVLKDCNLLWESISRGRRSRALVEAAFNEKFMEKDLTEWVINHYGNYILRYKDSEIFKAILEKGLISEVNRNNIKLVEEIILADKENKKALKLIDRYIQYSLYTFHNNISFIDEIKDVLIKYIDEDKAILLYYNDYLTSDRFKKLALNALLSRSHFSSLEAALIIKQKEAKALFMKINLFKLNIKTPMEANRFKIDVKFEAYEKNETFDYFYGVQNYYFFPESPLKIRLNMHGNIVECKKEDFECRAVSDAAAAIPKINIKKELSGCDTAARRFLMFLYVKSENFVLDCKRDAVLYFLNNKKLFSRELYLDILRRLQKRENKLGGDLGSRINSEILSITFNAEAFHNAVLGESSLEAVMELLAMVRITRLEIQIRTYLHIFSRALNEKFLDINLGILCEEFVCRYAIINEDIYKFLEKCYSIYHFNSEYTDTSVKAIELYMKEDINSKRLTIYRLLTDNKFDYKFYSVFMSLYEEKGPEDQLIVDSVNSLVHQEKYYFEYSYLPIFKTIYERDKNNMILLQEIILKSIDLQIEVSEDYLRTLSDFYIKTRFLSSNVLKVLCCMVKKGFTDGIDLYLISALEYEFIPTNVQHEGYLYYKTSLEDKAEVIPLLENSLEQPILAGYCNQVYYSFKKDNSDFVTVERSHLEENMPFFISCYGRIENSQLKRLVGRYCVSTGIFDELILRDYLYSYEKSSVEAGYILIKNLLPYDTEKTAVYLTYVVELIVGLQEAYNLKKLIYHLSKSYLGSVIEMLELVGKRIKSVYLEELTLEIMERALDIGDFNKLEAVFKLYYQALNQSRWQKLFVRYVKGVDRVAAENKTLILEFYKDCHGAELRNEIKDYISVKNDGQYEFASLLYEFYKIEPEEGFKSLIFPIFLMYPRYCSEEETWFFLKEAELLAQNKDKLKKFIWQCPKTKDIIKLVYDLCIEYCESDIDFARKLLRNIRGSSEQAGNLYKMLIKKNVRCIHGYIFTEEGDTTEFGGSYKANSIEGAKEALVLKLENRLSEAINIYITAEGIASIRKRGDYYLVENTSAIKENAEAFTLLDSCLQLLILLKMLSQRDLVLEKLKPESVVLVDNKPMLTDLFCAAAQIGTEGETDYFLIEQINSLIKHYIYNIKKDIEEMQLKLISELMEGSKADNVDEYELKMRKLVDRLASLSLEGFDVRRGIEDFDLLDDGKKDIIVKYLIENDIFNAKIYNFMIKDKANLEMKLDYLLSNYTESREKAKNLWDMLMKPELSEIKVSKKTRELIVNFARSSVKNNFVSRKKAQESIAKAALLTNEDKESLMHFLYSK